MSFYLTESDIKTIYEGYIDNLKNMIFPLKRVKLKDMNIEFDENRTWSKISAKDDYIKKYMNEKKGLGEHIVKHGTYWPFSCYVKNGKYYVAEGVHRYESLMMIADNALLEKEFLCIIIPESVNKMSISEIRWDNEDSIDWPVDIKIPILRELDDFAGLYEGFRFHHQHNMTVIEKAKEKEVISIKAININKYMSIFKVYPKIMRKVFFLYEQHNGKPYPPHPFINRR